MSDGRRGGGAAAKGCILLGFGAGVLAVVGAAVVMLGRDMGPAVTANEPVAVEEGWRKLEGQQAAEAVERARAAAGPAVQAIVSRGVLRVAMDTGEPPWTGTPPMFQMGADGTPDGFDHVLARRIATALGVGEVKVVHVKYSGLEDALRDPGQGVDLVISGFTPYEAEGIAWSEPYLEYGLCLVVPAGSPVQTTADLFGKKVGIFDDDAAAEEVGRLVKGYTELVRLEDGYWDQLQSGRFAAFLYDYPYAVAEIRAWYAQNPSREGALRIAQYNLTDSTYAVAMRADAPDLLAAVNGAIAEWRASDAYAEAVRAWLKGGEGLPAPKDQGRVVRVQAGDTLSGIAKRELGSVDRWKEIWAKNQERFPNPHLIEPGDEVVLP
jgi:ABC-type amino acid transport substrate-binding protein